MGFTAPEFNECKVVNQFSDASGKPLFNPQVKCQHCEKLFRGGAFRIRGHLLGLSKRGVAGCPALVAAHFCVLMRAELEHLRLHPQQKRNRLTAGRAEKLAFVFSNLRMLTKLAQLDYEEQCWSWEDEEDAQEGNVML